MKFTVISPLGKVMCFYIRSVAEMYRLNCGGVLVCSDVLDTLVDCKVI